MAAAVVIVHANLRFVRHLREFAPVHSLYFDYSYECADRWGREGNVWITVKSGIYDSQSNKQYGQTACASVFLVSLSCVDGDAVF